MWCATILSLELLLESLDMARYVEIVDMFKTPGARFSKAPETFRAHKAIFSSSVSKNWEV